MDPILGLFIFFFGCMIGSFLNVCIVRLPLNRSVVWPGSHCFKCGKSVRWFDNIPLVSYLILGGKCRDCSTAFSVRYFLIELLTGLSFFGMYFYFGLDLLLIPYLVLLGGLIVATFVDFEYRIIPDQLSLYGIPFALLMAVLMPRMQLEKGLPSLFIGMYVGCILVGVCAVLMWLEAFKRKARLTKEDLYLIAGAFGVLALQALLMFLAPKFSGIGQNMISLAAALQGGLIGGACLYFMGILGSLMIQKRVVTAIDLREISEASEGLFKELIATGYLNDGGEITAKFTELKGADGLQLSADISVPKQKVYDLIMSCQEGGVMGGGDVKLMAVVGAFLGWKLAVLTIVLAPFFGAPVGIIEKIRTKSSAIAFGPYLALASLVSLIWGEHLIYWIVSGYGMY